MECRLLIEKTLIVMDSDCRIGFAAFSDNPVNPVILSKEAAPGFTLVELLVALAIFGILMAAVVIVFVGSLRTTQTGYQQMDAFERARTALSVIDDDLVRGYASHQSGDVHSFYGTPIGMTFVGVVQMTSDAKDVNQARITYVVYNQMLPGAEPFPIIDESTGDVTGYQYPYPLLRYVEPGVGDLESFCIPWDDDPNTPRYYLPIKLRIVLNCMCGQALGLSDPTAFDSTRSDLSKAEQDVVRSKMCEMWIRILAGGDPWRELLPQLGQLPPISFWQVILPVLLGRPVDYADYIVTENITWEVSPDKRGDSPFDVTPFFDYAVPNYDPNAEPLSGSPWWNDPRAWNWREPRLPEVVIAKFWLMFPSPYPGAPDFQRRFTLEVNLPVGYTRVRD